LQSEISDIKALVPRVFEDDRGFFFEAWNQRQFAETTGYEGDFVQDNQSGSVKGVLRGLHYQLAPRPQGKLVRAVFGAVFDVAVDIRRSSPQFGSWVGVELSADNRKQLWVPPGFAHGFLAVSERAEILYKVTNYYSPEHDRSIRWDDQDIAIEWPLDGEPILSDKDASAPYLAEAELFA
jgi:dTDP-4-dehydrorhamnose 3,5-epimerase